MELINIKYNLISNQIYTELIRIYNIKFNIGNEKTIYDFKIVKDIIITILNNIQLYSKKINYNIFYTTLHYDIGNISLYSSYSLELFFYHEKIVIDFDDKKIYYNKTTFPLTEYKNIINNEIKKIYELN